MDLADPEPEVCSEPLLYRIRRKVRPVSEKCLQNAYRLDLTENRPARQKRQITDGRNRSNEAMISFETGRF